jgi:hypothetical protein
VGTLRFLLLLLVGGAAPDAAVLARPEVMSRIAWGAKPAKEGMRAHKIERITIHHTAERQRPTLALDKKLRGLQRFSQNDGKLADGRSKPAWPDIPYHFFIDAHGVIGEGRDLAFAGDTNTEYNPQGHALVVLEGNFEEETPTPEQLEAAHALVRWLAATYEVPADKIGGHRDYAVTSCPGKNLYARLDELRAEASPRKTEGAR